MNTSGMTISLAMVTLLAGVIVAAVALAWFLRRRRNRHPLKPGDLGYDGPSSRAVDSDGAAVERDRNS